MSSTARGRGAGTGLHAARRTSDVDVQLSAMRGTKVAILFFPFDFSPG